MENHPIPQDITGFKFKLIGSITVKQFAYLVTAAIIGYIILILPVFLFLKIPFVTLVGLFGFALAFIPFEGRPLDIMIINFIKAIPSENEYIYKKSGHNLEFLTATYATRSQNSAVSHQLPSMPAGKFTKIPPHPLEDHEQAFVSTVGNYFQTVQTPVIPQPTQQTSISTAHFIEPKQQSIATTPAQQPTPEPALQTYNSTTAPSPITFQNKTNPSQQLPFVRIISKQNLDSFEEENISEQKSEPEEKPQEQTLQQQEEVAQKAAEELPTIAPEKSQQELLHEAQVQKQLEEEQTYEQLGKQFQQFSKQKPQPTQAASQGTRVRALTDPQDLVNAGFPAIPDVPNIVLGILRDPRGKMLQGVLVEIVDRNQIPVRAFKTNSLGQFASATPLPAGDYTIIITDPQKQQEFEEVGIQLTGQIFQPIEITSIDAREKLRQELFGS